MVRRGFFRGGRGGRADGSRVQVLGSAVPVVQHPGGDVSGKWMSHRPGQPARPLGPDLTQAIGQLAAEVQETSTMAKPAIALTPPQDPLTKPYTWAARAPSDEASDSDVEMGEFRALADRLAVDAVDHPELVSDLGGLPAVGFGSDEALEAFDGWMASVVGEPRELLGRVQPASSSETEAVPTHVPAQPPQAVTPLRPATPPRWADVDPASAVDRPRTPDPMDAAPAREPGDPVEGFDPKVALLEFDQWIVSDGGWCGGGGAVGDWVVRGGAGWAGRVGGCGLRWGIWWRGRMR